MLAESQDQGKTIGQAAGLEIPRCVANIRYFANLMVSLQGQSSELEGPTPARSVVRYEPMGVVGIISPWNLPLYLLTWKAAPALAMGNCVVAKPSEMTSLTAFKLAKLFPDAGFPPGVFNLVFGYGQSAGQALVMHPNVRAISFTGGTVTGRRIAEMAAQTGKKVSLELGGKNPAIIFADSDLDLAVETSVRAAFANQGEVCLCCSRILVERPIYASFMEKFIPKVKGLVVGDPSSPTTSVGALVSKAHQEKVLSYISLALKEGHTVCCGSASAPKITGFEEGYFVLPTVIADVGRSSPLMREEIFGPVVCVMPFDSEDEAILIANEIEYGLAASIWSKDGQKARRVAERVKSGVVWINCWMVRDLATPFGGVKASGYGREGGEYSLIFFSDIKTITVCT